jgi:hypothetical protein
VDVCPFDEEFDPFGIRRRRRIVDRHAEIRSSIDRERRIFEGERAKGPSDPLEHVRRRGAAAALFQPRIPGWADIRPLCHLLATQARHATTLRRKPSAVLQAGFSERETRPLFEKSGAKTFGITKFFASFC